MIIISAHSPAYLANGDISLMVNFSGMGEIPFGASPNDSEAHGRELFTRAITGDYGPITPYVAPVPTSEQIIAALTAAVQSHLDAAARAKGYDGILSAASYAGDSHPPFNSEGVAFRDWRGAVWATCYAIMANVQSGLRPVPDAATLISELPALVLP